MVRKGSFRQNVPAGFQRSGGGAGGSKVAVCWIVKLYRVEGVSLGVRAASWVVPALGDAHAARRIQNRFAELRAELSPCYTSTRNAEPSEAGRDSSLSSGGRGCSGDDAAVGTMQR